MECGKTKESDGCSENERMRKSRVGKKSILHRARNLVKRGSQDEELVSSFLAMALPDDRVDIKNPSFSNLSISLP